MWYVIQVISGQENQTILLIEKMVSEGTIKQCFVPIRRLKKKFCGAWHDVTEKLFPGYVFLITEQPQLLYEELKGVPALTKILGRNEEYFTPLTETDVQIMKKLQDGVESNQSWEIEISEVLVEAGNRIKILSGPLVNLKGQIKKINLHKRIAAVEVEFMGRKTVVNLGIEMVERTG
jgi:transcriptional antiterminator NusG